MAFSVRYDDRFKDRLQHCVGKLKLHLPPAGLGIAHLAQPHRRPAQLARDHTKAVAAAPFHAVFQVSLRNALRISGQSFDGPQNEENRRRCNQRSGTGDRISQMQLPTRCQRPMRQGNQRNRQAGQEHTAEKQSLGKVGHVRCPRRRVVTTPFSRIQPNPAKPIARKF